jgi:hypothetical protein
LLLLVSGATLYPREENEGYLIAPKQWSRKSIADLRPRKWAIDNFAYSGFDVAAFMRTLEVFYAVPGCLFVSAPDVVGDAAATRDLWPFWSRLIRGLGLTPGFVAQDGIRPDQVPWDDGIALFIGGTTEFKESSLAMNLIGYAKARGIWAHVGRVNGRRRYAMMLKAGADSIDGTGFSRHPDVNIPLVDEWRHGIEAQPSLLDR